MARVRVNLFFCDHTDASACAPACQHLLLNLDVPLPIKAMLHSRANRPTVYWRSTHDKPSTAAERSSTSLLLAAPKKTRRFGDKWRPWWCSTPTNNETYVTGWWSELSLYKNPQNSFLMFHFSQNIWISLPSSCRLWAFTALCKLLSYIFRWTTMLCITSCHRWFIWFCI